MMENLSKEKDPSDFFTKNRDFANLPGLKK
jgi:hypothetical protein